VSVALLFGNYWIVALLQVTTVFFSVRRSLSFSIRRYITFAFEIVSLNYSADTLNYFVPSIAVEWLSLLPRTQEFWGSNVGPVAGYPDRCLVLFISPSRLVAGKYFKIGQDRMRPYNLQLMIHRSSSLSYATESAVEKRQ
jgi:hypothetical protein